MDLSERIARLRALIARPGTPEEGDTANRILIALLVKYGQDASERDVSPEEELRFVRYVGTLYYLESEPFVQERLVVALEPSAGTSQSAHLLLSATIINPTEHTERPMCLDRGLLLLARGESLVSPGEFIRVVLMLNPGVPYHSYHNPRRIRVTIRFGFRAERLRP